MQPLSQSSKHLRHKIHRKVCTTLLMFILLKHSFDTVNRQNATLVSAELEAKIKASVLLATPQDSIQ